MDNSDFLLFKINHGDQVANVNKGKTLQDGHYYSLFVPFAKYEPTALDYFFDGHVDREDDYGIDYIGFVKRNKIQDRKKIKSGSTLVFFQSKSGSGAISHNDVDLMIAGIRKLISGNVSGANSSVKEWAKIINKNKNNISKVKMICVFKTTKNSNSNQIQDTNKQAISDMKKLFGVPSEIEYMSHEDVSLKSKKYTNVFNLSKNKMIIKNKDEYVILMNTTDYKRGLLPGIFKTKFKKQSLISLPFFDENVRNFKGSTKINKELKAAVADENKHFWIMNNGVTLTTSKIIRKNNNLILENVKVINGLQTTYTLLSNDEVSQSNDILVRIIKTNDRELKYNLIKATNNQNKIPEKALTANNSNLISLERALVRKEILFDRQEGKYSAYKKTKKYIFISNAEVSKIAAIWNGEPSFEVRNKPNKYLSSDELINKTFTADVCSNFYKLINIYKTVRNVCKNFELITGAISLSEFVTHIYLCNNSLLNVSNLKKWSANKVKEKDIVSILNKMKDDMNALISSGVSMVDYGRYGKNSKVYFNNISKEEFWTRESGKYKK